MNLFLIFFLLRIARAPPLRLPCVLQAPVTQGRSLKTGPESQPHRREKDAGQVKSF